MARMDYSATITKRRSLPRILCSSKKNTWSSPIETNLIKQVDDTSSDQKTLALLKQEIESSEDEDRRSTPEQRLCGGSQTPPSLPNSQPSSSSPLLTTTKETTSPVLCRSEIAGSTDDSDPVEERVDEQEIRVSPMITVRRGPQVRLPPRRVRCSLTTSENADTSLTPNEMLLALVNLFAPPVDVEEKPPELEREGPPSPVHSSVVDHMDYTTDPTRDAAPVSVAACLNESLKQHLSNDTTPSRISYLTQLANDTGNKQLSGARQDVALEAKRTSDIERGGQVRSPRTGIVGSKDDQKYSSLTLGSVIGIRRPRVTNTQNSCGNLTLDQLNPTLAEALAAMKSKSDAVGKTNGYIGSHNGSDGLCRRDSLPTRMSGPVKLESLSSTSQCASTPTGHLVSFNGQTTEVPEEIHCHLCDYPMKLCIRKSKYKGEIREYAAYRCLRKGCQTFRSVRKVIEPDYPCARKRKPEEMYGGQNSPYAVLRDTPSNSMRISLKDPPSAGGSDGTLLYVPGKVTLEQIEQMQKFTFGFINKDSSSEYVYRALFAFVNMTAADIDEHLKTDDGQKRLQRILTNPMQPPIPVSQMPPVEVPQVRAPLSNPQVHINSVPQMSQNVFNSPASAPQMPAPPSAVAMAPHPAVSMCCTRAAGITSNILSSLLEAAHHPDSVLSDMQCSSQPTCGMAMQTRVPEVRSHQYATELIW